MTRRIWIGVVLVAAFAGSLLLRQPPLPADLEAAPATPESVRAVQVRYDVVVVPMPSPVKGTGSRSPREVPTLSASAANRPAVSGTGQQTRRAEAPLLAKVRRAVAGDGRYRPEPFPRVR